MFRTAPLLTALIVSTFALTGCEESESRRAEVEPINLERPAERVDGFVTPDPTLPSDADAVIAALEDAVAALQDRNDAMEDAMDVADDIRMAIGERVHENQSRLDDLQAEQGALAARVHDHDADFDQLRDDTIELKGRVANVKADLDAQGVRVSTLEDADLVARFIDAPIGGGTECVLTSPDDPHMAIVYSSYAGDIDGTLLASTANAGLFLPQAEEAKCGPHDDPESISPLIWNSDGIFVRVDDVDWFALQTEEVTD